MRPSQLKKLNNIENMIKVGIPDVVWCFFDKNKALAFKEPLGLKKKSVQDILSFQLELQNYADKFGKYRFDANREVDISVSTTIVPKEVYSSEMYFRPLEGGALESIHKILLMIYRLSNVWTGSLGNLGMLRDKIFHAYKELVECGFVCETGNGGMNITFVQWCDNDFNLGKRVLTIVQQISSDLVDWISAKDRGSWINFKDGNTSKQRAGLNGYVKAVMQEIKEPYIMRFLLTYDPRYRFGKERVVDIVSIWKRLIAERKSLFEENVRGFFWKVEVVGEVLSGERDHQPIWGVQLILILDSVLGITNERVITELLWQKWFDLNYEHFSKTDNQICHFGEKEGLTPCNSPFCVYSVLVSQSELLPLLKKDLKNSRQWRDSLNESLHGCFNKKNGRAKQALSYLVDYFVSFDILLSAYVGTNANDLVQNKSKNQEYQRKMKMFGRGQIHKKHNSRKIHK